MPIKQPQMKTREMLKQRCMKFTTLLQLCCVEIFQLSIVGWKWQSQTTFSVARKSLDLLHQLFGGCLDHRVTFWAHDISSSFGCFIREVCCCVLCVVMNPSSPCSSVFNKTSMTTKPLEPHTHIYIYIFQEYEEPVYSYSTYPDRRFSSRYHNILKMSPPFASSEGVSASGDRYQSDDA